MTIDKTGYVEHISLNWLHL